LITVFSSRVLSILVRNVTCLFERDLQPHDVTLLINSALEVLLAGILTLTTMVKVTLNGSVIAESNNTVTVENNYYFPPEDVKTDLLSLSQTTYTCPWKGNAEYYNAEIDGKTVADVTWVYPEPKEAAKNIKGYFAFDKKQTTIA